MERQGVGLRRTCHGIWSPLEFLLHARIPPSVHGIIPLGFSIHTLLRRTSYLAWSSLPSCSRIHQLKSLCPHSTTHESLRQKQRRNLQLLRLPSYFPGGAINRHVRPPAQSIVFSVRNRNSAEEEIAIDAGSLVGDMDPPLHIHNHRHHNRINFNRKNLKHRPRPRLPK